MNPEEAVHTRVDVRARAALEQTFGVRKTHHLTVTLPEPPALRAGPHAAMALEDQLGWPTLSWSALSPRIPATTTFGRSSVLWTAHASSLQDELEFQCRRKKMSGASLPAR